MQKLQNKTIRVIVNFHTVLQNIFQQALFTSRTVAMIIGAALKWSVFRRESRLLVGLQIGRLAERISYPFRSSESLMVDPRSTNLDVKPAARGS
jgi:hypothetical protein